MAVLRLKDFVFRARVQIYEDSRFQITVNLPERMARGREMGKACLLPDSLRETVRGSTGDDHSCGAIRLLPATVVAARQAQRACSYRLWFLALHDNQQHGI